jgi:hypothetical protein
VERASGELHRKGKGPCFVLYGGYPTALNYKDLIAVSPEKAYILKASFRSLDPKLPASAYLGVDVFDKEKRRIGYYNIQVLYHTDSEVVSAKKGDKFLTIRKFEMKKKIGRFRVAFNTRKDYSDIPNFDLSPMGKSLKEDENGNAGHPVGCRRSNADAHCTEVEYENHNEIKTDVDNARDG